MGTLTRLRRSGRALTEDCLCPTRAAMPGSLRSKSAQAGTPVLVLVHDLHVRMLTSRGELLRDLILDPSRDYEPPASA